MDPQIGGFLFSAFTPITGIVLEIHVILRDSWLAFCFMFVSPLEHEWRGQVSSCVIIGQPLGSCQPDSANMRTPWGWRGAWLMMYD